MNIDPIIIGAVVLMVVEARILMFLVDAATEDRLKFLSGCYVSFAIGVCSSWIARFLTPYLGLPIAYLVARAAMSCFLVGYLIDKFNMSGKVASIIAAIFLVIDIVLKVILVFALRLF